MGNYGELNPSRQSPYFKDTKGACWMVLPYVGKWSELVFKKLALGFCSWSDG